MSQTKIKQIDQGLSRYYKLHNINDYFNNDERGKFEEFCDENGFDDNDVKDELDQDIDDCCLTDFDDDFPISDDTNDKNQIIFDVIKKCLNDEYAYSNNKQHASFKLQQQDFTIPKLKSNTYSTDDDSEDESKYLSEELQIHCKAIFGLSDINHDRALISILYIGIQNIGKPYLSLLADLYARDRITYYLQFKQNNDITLKFKPLNVSTWSLLNRHMKQMKNWCKEYELLQSALNSYYNRLCPLLTLTAQYEIIDNYEEICDYISSAVDFVYNLANEKFTDVSTCPFQYDCCFAFNETKPISNIQNANDLAFEDSSDDEFEDNDEKKCDYFDCFGNVKMKLKKMGLIFNAAQVESDNVDDEKKENIGKRFKIRFDEFRELIKKKRDEIEFEGYPRKKRFISLLDRRQRTDENKENDIMETDELIFFEPPSDCFKFPENTQYKCNDIWYFNSSKTCIIPNVCKQCFDLSEACSNKICGYNQEHFTSYDAKEQQMLNDEKKICEKKIKEADMETDTIKRQKMRVINTIHAMKNGMLVLSFHVESVDDIRCYLYLGGHVVRFFAEDLNTYLPQFFEDREHNVTYANGNVIKGLIERIKGKLIDNTFDAFYKRNKLDVDIITQHIDNKYKTN